MAEDFKTCKVDTCNRRSLSRGMCTSHYGMLMNYGLTPEQYQTLLDAQGGTCAVCAETHSDGSRLQVDHDHACCPTTYTCGSCIRGLLCRRCNGALGPIDRVGIEQFQGYLARHAMAGVWSHPPPPPPPQPTRPDPSVPEKGPR